MALLKNLLRCLAILVSFAPIFALGQDLCPPSKPLPEDIDDIRMVEKEFTFSKALKSLNWLEGDFWTVIREHKTTEELLRSTERFGIPFPNSVSIVKGTILHQQALLERERLEVAILRFKEGSGSKADIEAARKRFENATRDFCKFLEKAKWVD